MIYFYYNILKGQCHDIYDLYFFCSPDITRVTYKQAKKILQTVFAKITKLEILVDTQF